jgi:lipopolysaccharide export system permease protein
MRRSHRTIYWYLFKEFFFSFVVAFLFFFFIFFVNHLLLLAEEILSKSVPFGKVLLLIVYSLPFIVAMAFPFSSLVGALMAVGRLSSDNEALAFQASGVSRMRLFYPIVVLGALFMVSSFIMNDYFLPLGTINFSKLYREILYTNPQLELEANAVKRYQDSTMVTGNVEGDTIDDIIIFDKTAEKKDRVISAQKAILRESAQQQGIISFRLEDVFTQVADPKVKTRFEYSAAREMMYNIPLQDLSFAITNPGPREMRSVDVYKRIQEKSAAFAQDQRELRLQQLRVAYELVGYYTSAAEGGPPAPGRFAELNQRLARVESEMGRKVRDRTLQVYRLEFYKKFSVPAACLVFVFFAFPVGLFTKRSGRTVGFGIGLLVSIFYWGLLIAGHTLGIRLAYSPFLSMWAPNFIILALGLLFFALRFRR